MSREELKEIIVRVITAVREEPGTPSAACVFNDQSCDAVYTVYAVGEEG